MHSRTSSSLQTYIHTAIPRISKKNNYEVKCALNDSKSMKEGDMTINISICNAGTLLLLKLTHTHTHLHSRSSTELVNSELSHYLLLV